MSGRRATSLSPPERFLLNAWGAALEDAFGPTAWLVGSVARAEPWRDVDVRLMFPTSDFVALAGTSDRRLAALNAALSMWGQRVTGLPIDFQFQEVEEANAEHNGPRVPLWLSR